MQPVVMRRYSKKVLALFLTFALVDVVWNGNTCKGCESQLSQRISAVSTVESP